MRRLIVLGLRQKIGGDKARIGAPVGKHHHFAGARDHVDADDSEHAPLGRRDIGVAGADDLVDRGDRLRPVGERGDRLRAADPIDLVHASDARRGERQGIDMAVGRRHDHRQAAAARDLGRHGVHDDRGRIGRGAPRNVEADRVDRPPPPAELDAKRVGEEKIGRLLAQVKIHHPGVRELERVERGFSQAPIAASISATSIFSPILPISIRSKRSDNSASDASPRCRTSSMMSATVRSTSADVSRLAATSDAKRWSKSADCISSATAMAKRNSPS